MNKEDLIRNITETAYNVGFGAKKHFATYDIVSKAPGIISFISIAIGILALCIDSLATRHMSAILIILGIAGLFIHFFDSNKNEYDNAGKELTQLFNNLKSLYYEIKGSNKKDFSKDVMQLKKIEEKYQLLSISKQHFLSDWYAHYKFFWQNQIDWLDEEKQFKLWRDKIPLSFLCFVIITIFLLIFFIVMCKLS